MHTRSLLHTRRLLSLGIAFLVVLLAASTCLTLIHFNKGNLVHATGSQGSSFTFTAAGDYDQTSATTANLKYIAQSGANFNLALGDFDYNPAVTAAQWSSYATGLLPANFPFEVIPGEHDVSQLAAYAAALPDHIGTTSGTYVEQYYFDYPPNAPYGPLHHVLALHPLSIQLHVGGGWLQLGLIYHRCST